MSFEEAMAVPSLRFEDAPIQVHNPAFGLQLDHYYGTAEGAQPVLSRRQWRDVVRSDAELYFLHRRSKTLVPGVILASGGAAILSLSVASAIDGYGPSSATGILVGYVGPASALLTGVALTSFGAYHRGKLNQRRIQLTAGVAPSRGGGSAAITGRF